MLTRYCLPRRFWSDHLERCADHAGVRRVLRETDRYVVVDLDRAAIADLRSDADLYRDGVDMAWSGLRSSAIATLAALQMGREVSE